MNTGAICFDHVSYTVSSSRWETPKEILKNACLNIEKHEIWAFLGSNGCGKTTTLHMVAGLLKPHQGTVFLHGVASYQAQARTHFLYVPERPCFPMDMTGLEFCTQQGMLCGHFYTQAKNQAWEALGILELDYAAKGLIKTYSKGMIQRLALSQLFIANPHTCILDEPMGGLDVEGRALVQHVLSQKKEQGLTMLITSHHVEEIRALCTHVATLKHGLLETTL
jgi:ABC-2 type transport system ATP-binding protein